MPGFSYYIAPYLWRAFLSSSLSLLESQGGLLLPLSLSGCLSRLSSWWPFVSFSVYVWLYMFVFRFSLSLPPSLSLCACVARFVCLSGSAPVSLSSHLLSASDSKSLSVFTTLFFCLPLSHPPPPPRLFPHNAHRGTQTHDTQ